MWNLKTKKKKSKFLLFLYYINTQLHPKMFNFHTKLEITKFKDIST